MTPSPSQVDIKQMFNLIIISISIGPNVIFRIIYSVLWCLGAAKKFLKKRDLEAEKRLIQRWEKKFVGTPYVVHVNQYDCIGDIRQKITCNFGLIRSADHHEMIAEIATTKDLKRVIAARLRVPLNQVHLQFHSVLSDMKASATKELGNAIKGELTEEFEEFEEFEEAAADMMPSGRSRLNFTLELYWN